MTYERPEYFVEYRSLDCTDFGTASGAWFVWHQGMYCFVYRRTGGILELVLNDEMRAEPFSKRDVDALRCALPVLSVTLDDTWEHTGNETASQPFHHNILRCRFPASASPHDVVRYVFTRLYDAE